MKPLSCTAMDIVCIRQLNSISVSVSRKQDCAILVDAADISEVGDMSYSTVGPLR